MKKRLLGLFFVALGTFALILMMMKSPVEVHAETTSPSVSSYVYKNDGKPHFYSISTEEEFRSFLALEETSPSDIFKLESDILMSTTPVTPMKSFKGMFDGNHKKISELVLQNENDSLDVCLFEEVSGSISDLTIKRLKINRQGTVVKQEDSPYGFGEACLIKNLTGTFSHVTVEGCIFSDKAETQEYTLFSTSAIVAKNSGVIRRCVSNGNHFYGLAYASGMVGINTADGSIEGVEANAVVATSLHMVGGIAALNDGIISSSTCGVSMYGGPELELSKPNVTVDGSLVVYDTFLSQSFDYSGEAQNYAGGIVGYSTKSSTVFNCSFDGYMYTRTEIAGGKAAIRADIGVQSIGFIAGYTASSLTHNMAHGNIYTIATYGYTSKLANGVSSLLFGGSSVNSSSDNYIYDSSLYYKDKFLEVIDTYVNELTYDGYTLEGFAEDFFTINDQNEDYVAYKIKPNYPSSRYDFEEISTKKFEFRLHTYKSSSSLYDDLSKYRVGLFITSTSRTNPFENMEVFYLDSITSSTSSGDTVYSGNAQYTKKDSQRFFWYYDALLKEYALAYDNAYDPNFGHIQTYIANSSDGNTTGFDLYSILFKTTSDSDEDLNLDIGLKSRFMLGKMETMGMLENQYKAPEGYYLSVENNGYDKTYVNNQNIMGTFSVAWYGYNVNSNSILNFYYNNGYVKYHINNGAKFDDENEDSYFYYEDGDVLSLAYHVGDSFGDYTLSKITIKENTQPSFSSAKEISSLPANMSSGHFYEISLDFKETSSLKSFTPETSIIVDGESKVVSFIEFFASTGYEQLVLIQDGLFGETGTVYIISEDSYVFGKTSDGELYPIYDTSNQMKYSTFTSVVVTYKDPDTSENESVTAYSPTDASCTGLYIEIPEVLEGIDITVDASSVSTEISGFILENCIRIDKATKRIKLTGITAKLSFTVTYTSSTKEYNIYYYSNSVAFLNYENDKNNPYGASPEYANCKTSSTFQYYDGFDETTEGFMGFYDANKTKWEVGTTLTEDIYVYEFSAHKISNNTISIKSGTTEWDNSTKYEDIEKLLCLQAGGYFYTFHPSMANDDLLYVPGIYLEWNASYTAFDIVYDVAYASLDLKIGAYYEGEYGDSDPTLMYNMSITDSADPLNITLAQFTVSYGNDIQPECQHDEWFYKVLVGIDNQSSSISFKFQSPKYSYTVKAGEATVENTMEYNSATVACSLSWNNLPESYALTFTFDTRMCQYTIKYLDQDTGTLIYESSATTVAYGTNIRDALPTPGTLLTEDGTTYLVVSEETSSYYVVDDSSVSMRFQVKEALTKNIYVNLAGESFDPSYTYKGLYNYFNGCTAAIVDSADSTAASAAYYRIEGNTLYYYTGDTTYYVWIQINNTVEICLGAVTGSFGSSETPLEIYKLNVSANENISTFNSPYYAANESAIYVYPSSEITIPIRYFGYYTATLNDTIDGISVTDGNLVIANTFTNASKVLNLSLSTQAQEFNLRWEFYNSDGTVLSVKDTPTGGLTEYTQSDIPYGNMLGTNYGVGALMYTVVDEEDKVAMVIRADTLPETMPGHDVTIKVYFTYEDLRTLGLTLTLDGEEYTIQNDTLHVSSSEETFEEVYDAVFSIDQIDSKYYYYTPTSGSIWASFNNGQKYYISPTGNMTENVEIYSIVFDGEGIESVVVKNNSVSVFDGALGKNMAGKPYMYYFSGRDYTVKINTEDHRGLKLLNVPSGFSFYDGINTVNISPHSPTESTTLTFELLDELEKFNLNYAYKFVDGEGNAKDFEISNTWVSLTYGTFDPSIVKPVNDYFSIRVDYNTSTRISKYSLGKILSITYNGESSQPSNVDCDMTIEYTLLFLEAVPYSFTCDGYSVDPYWDEDTSKWYLNSSKTAYFSLKNGDEESDFTFVTAELNNVAETVKYFVANVEEATLYLVYPGQTVNLFTYYKTEQCTHSQEDGNYLSETKDTEFIDISVSVTAGDGESSYTVKGDGYYPKNTLMTVTITAPNNGRTLDVSSIDGATITTEGKTITLTFSSGDSSNSYVLPAKKNSYKITYNIMDKDGLPIETVDSTPIEYEATISYDYVVDMLYTKDSNTYIIVSVVNFDDDELPTTMSDSNVTVNVVAYEAESFTWDVTVDGETELVVDGGKIYLSSEKRAYLVLSKNASTYNSVTIPKSSAKGLVYQDGTLYYITSNVGGIMFRFTTDLAPSSEIYGSLIDITDVDSTKPSNLWYVTLSGLGDKATTSGYTGYYKNGANISVGLTVDSTKYTMALNSTNPDSAALTPLGSGQYTLTCEDISEDTEIKFDVTGTIYYIYVYKDKDALEKKTSDSTGYLGYYEKIPVPYGEEIQYGETIGTVEGKNRLDSWLNEDDTDFDLESMPSNDVFVYGNWIPVGSVTVTAKFYGEGSGTQNIQVRLSLSNKDNTFVELTKDLDENYTYEALGNDQYFFTYDTASTAYVWIQYPGDLNYTYAGKATGFTEVSYTYFLVEYDGTVEHSTITGGGWTKAGETAIFSIENEIGWELSVVSGEYSINNNQYTIPVVSNYTKVTFSDTHTQYKLMYFIGEDKNPWKTEYYYYGDAITFAEYPSGDYEFSGWTVADMDMDNPVMPDNHVVAKGKVTPIKRVNVTIEFPIGITYENFYVCSSSTIFKNETQATMNGDEVQFRFTGEGYIWIFDPISEEYRCLGIQPVKGMHISLVKITKKNENTHLSFENLGYLLNGSSQYIKITPDKGYAFRVNDSNVSRVGDTIIIEGITEDFELDVEEYMIEYTLTYYVLGNYYASKKYTYKEKVTMLAYKGDEFNFDRWSLYLEEMPDYDVNVYAQAKADFVVQEYPVLTKIHAGEKLSASEIQPGVITLGGVEYEGIYYFKNKDIIVSLADSMKTEYEVLFEVENFVPLSIMVTVEVCNPRFELPMQDDFEAINAILPQSSIVITDTTFAFTLNEKYEYSRDGKLYYAGGEVSLDNLTPDTEYTIYYRYKQDEVYCESLANVYEFKTLSVEEMNYNSSMEEGKSNLKDMYDKLDNDYVKTQISIIMAEISVSYGSADRTMSAEEMQQFVAYVSEVFEMVYDIEYSRNSVVELDNDRIQGYADDKEKEISDWVFGSYTSDRVATETIKDYQKFITNVYSACDGMVDSFDVSKADLEGRKLTASSTDVSALNSGEFVVGKIDELMTYDHTNYSDISLKDYQNGFVGATVELMAKAKAAVHECDGSMFVTAINDSFVELNAKTYMDYKFDRAAYDAAFYLAAEAAIIAHLQSIVMANLDEQYAALVLEMKDAAQITLLEQVYQNLCAKYSDYEQFRELYFEAIGDSGDVTYEDVIEIFRQQIEDSLVLPVNSKFTAKEIVVMSCFGTAIALAAIGCCASVVLKKRRVAHVR